METDAKSTSESVNNEKRVLKVTVEVSNDSDKNGVSEQSRENKAGAEAEGDKDDTKRKSENVAKEEVSVEDKAEGKKEEAGSPPAKRVKLSDGEVIPVRIQGHREDPFFFCSKEDPVWPAIRYVWQTAL